MLVIENYFDRLMMTLNHPFCLFVEDKHYANATARKTLSGLFSSYANSVFCHDHQIIFQADFFFFFFNQFMSQG